MLQTRPVCAGFEAVGRAAATLRAPPPHARRRLGRSCRDPGAPFPTFGQCHPESRTEDAGRRTRIRRPGPASGSLTSHHGHGPQRREDGHPGEGVACGNRAVDTQPLSPRPPHTHTQLGGRSLRPARRWLPNQAQPLPVRAHSGHQAAPPALHLPSATLRPRSEPPGLPVLTPRGPEGCLHPESQNARVGPTVERSHGR